MKKILSAIVIALMCSMSSEVMAQYSGFYLFLGGGATKGMSFTKDQTTQNFARYSVNTSLFTFGAGYRFTETVALELGLANESEWASLSSSNINDDDGTSYSAYWAGLNMRNPISEDLNWIASAQFRKSFVNDHDLYGVCVEPCIIEYMTRSKQWGFQFSPISLEYMKTTKEKTTTMGYTIESPGTSAMGFSMNLFTMRVACYF